MPENNSQIPILRTRREKNQYWRECEERGDPFVIIKQNEDGFMPTYDLRRTRRLTDQGLKILEIVLQEIVDPYRGLDDGYKTLREISSARGSTRPIALDDAREVARHMHKITSEETEQLLKHTPTDQDE